VNESLVRRAQPKNAICVGKRKGGQSVFQAEINSLMVRYAGAGKTVVRLKGGDPCIFGRLWEEVEALRKNHIPYEIVPGISAAQGASAYAEIPLTRRDLSSSFSVCTGFPETSITVPASGTLVYYMSAESLPVVARRILEKGRPCETPACVVTAATTPHQSKSIGTLGYFSERESGYDSPAIFIVGEAVSRVTKSWFEKKKKVLVTGTTPERYDHLGEVIHDPMIECVPSELSDDGKAAFASLSDYSAILFTSKHAVHATFGLLFAMQSDARAICHMRILSIGDVTAAALRSYGLVPDLKPFSQSWRGLSDEMRRQGFAGENIIFPRSNIADPSIVTELEQMGNRVKAVVVYETNPAPDTGKIDLSDIDTIVFTSPSCVRNFRKKYGCIPRGIEIKTTGDVTLREVDDDTITAIP
jgi:uroporphyrinogen III methyltransferase/synthase